MKGLPVEMTSFVGIKKKKACVQCGLYGRIAVAIVNTLWGPATAFFNIGLI